MAEAAIIAYVSMIGVVIALAVVTFVLRKKRRREAKTGEAEIE